MNQLLLAVILLLYICHQASTATVRVVNPYTGNYICKSNETDVDVISSGIPCVWNLVKHNLCVGNTQRCLCPGKDSSKLKLGFQNAAGSSIIWKYDQTNMAFFTGSGTERKYLKISDSEVMLVSTNAEFTAKLVLQFVPTENDNELVDKIKTNLKTLKYSYTKMLDSYKKIVNTASHLSQQNNNITTKVSNAYREYSDSKNIIEDDYDDLFHKYDITKTNTNNQLHQLNGTQYDIISTVIPAIRTACNQNSVKPAHFTAQIVLAEGEMLKMLDTGLSNINKTLDNYQDKYRILPEGIYDWLVICTTVLYMVYLGDVTRRLYISTVRSCFKSRKSHVLKHPLEPRSEDCLHDDDNVYAGTSLGNRTGHLQLKDIM